MPCVLHVYFFVFDLFCLSFFLVFVFLASLIFFFTLVLFSIYGQTKDFGSTRLGRVKKKDIYLVWFCHFFVKGLLA